MKPANLIGVLVFCLFMSITANAAVPQIINYQGFLTGTGGAALDTTANVTFRILDVATGGSPIWTETQSVTSIDGLFTVLLGINTPIDESIIDATDRFLEVQLGASPFSPRTQLAASPYAIRIATVDGAAGGTISGDLALSGGNFNLENSSTSAGNIYKGSTPFIHNFGIVNTYIGENTGNLTMTGGNNTASGAYALRNNTTGSQNTASGIYALFNNSTGFYNTASGVDALFYNTTGSSNTASGRLALLNNTTGGSNTASGVSALNSNTTGNSNTAIGFGANVFSGNLDNATAIGAGAVVNASNKIRLGNSAVTVIEGQVAYTFTSDKNDKENFRPVDGNEVLRKIRGFELSSWNYKSHDPKQFRHYGPMAQDFFAAFGNDGVGKIGTETTLNSGDVAGILMIAVQALGNENAGLKTRVEHLEEMLKKIQASAPQAKKD